MKKFFAIATAAVGLLAASLGLAGCGNGNYSETFPGTLSEETYQTADAAAEAFLENEIAASDTQVQFVSYQKTKDISDEELASFDLDGVHAEDIGSKEWGTITYEAALRSAGVSVSSLASQTSAATLKVKVGMFEIGDTYRYFVPVAGTGEMISKSYFESVFDSSKYANCTQTFEMVVKSSASAKGQKFSLAITTKCTVKIAEDAAEMKMTVSGAAGQNASDATVTVYLFKKGDGIAAYADVNGYWQEYYELGISSWDEVYEMNLDDFIDYSYFEKTATGFKLAPMKFELFMEQFMEENMGAAMEDLGLTASMDLDGEATYFVTDGRLSKASVKVSVKMSQGGVSASASGSGVNTFSDFGTTEVHIPAALQAIVG